jgi:hypothetical protein
MNEFAELGVRSAISSVVIAPSVLGVSVTALAAFFTTCPAASDSSVWNFSAKSAEGASEATPTCRAILSKPSISTSIVQVPSANSAKLNAPCGSVVVTICLSPWLAVTVAPGKARPPAFTVPWYSEAISPVTAMHAATRRPRELPMRFVAITYKEGAAPVIVSSAGQSFTSLTHSLLGERSII